MFNIRLLNVGRSGPGRRFSLLIALCAAALPHRAMAAPIEGDIIPGEYYVYPDPPIPGELPVLRGFGYGETTNVFFGFDEVGALIDGVYGEWWYRELIAPAELTHFERVTGDPFDIDFIPTDEIAMLLEGVTATPRYAFSLTTNFTVEGVTGQLTDLDGVPMDVAKHLPTDYYYRGFLFDENKARFIFNIPEPDALGLFALGAALAFGRRRTRPCGASLDPIGQRHRWIQINPSFSPGTRAIRRRPAVHVPALWAMLLLAAVCAPPTFALPVIDSFAPPTAAEGMPVIIQGSGFSHTPSRNLVRMNGLEASVLRPTTPNVLVAIVPTGASTGPIEVEVDTETAMSTTPLVIQPDPGFVNSLEVNGDAGFQPLDYSVIAATSPAVRITLDANIPAIVSVAVFIVTSGLEEPFDTTADFVFGGVPPTATATRPLPAAANSFVVIVNDNLSFAGTMLNFDGTTLGFGAEMDPNKVSPDVDPESSLPYQTEFLEIGFVPGASASAIRNLLAAEELIPVGMFQDLTQAPAPLSVITDTARRDDQTAVELRDAIRGLGGVSYASLSIVESMEARVAERMPARLIVGGPYPTYGAATSNNGYSAPNGGFDHDATASGGVPVDELDLNWRHFFYQTFAGHRLRDHIIATVAPHGGAAPAVPFIAVVDTGFGNGGAAAGANPVLNDLPLARLGETDADGHAFDGIDALGGAITRPIVGPLLPGQVPLPEDRVPITGITDTVNPAGHGTIGALLAAGNGMIVQGTGPNMNVIPYRRANAADSREALRDIALRPEIDVINYSLAVGPYGTVALANAGAAGFVPRLNALNANGQILVVCAGNDRVDTGRHSPQVLSDARGAAAPNYPLMMCIAATDIPPIDDVNFGPVGPEETWALAAPGGTSFGNRISVCATGGQRMIVMTRAGAMRTTTGGTSWAAPQVSGLAAELVHLDEWLRGAPAAGAATRARRLQVVETIKATADDLGSTSAAAPFVNNDAGDGPEDNFGYGRINIWKAVLSIVNGGISAQHGRTAGAGGTDSVFTSLALRNDAQTSWYGFEIVTTERQATVWIDGTRLADAGTVGPDGAPGGGDDLIPLAPNITAYKGVRSHQRIERGVHNLTDGSAQDPVGGGRPGQIVEEDPTSGIVAVGTRVNNQGQYVMTFSIERSDLYSGANPRTLSLRRRSEDVTDKPIFNLRLETAKMRTGEISGVSFDDFVFQIVPTDYGDAGIPPTLMAAERGARHVNSNLEWLGKLDPVEPDRQPDTDGATRRNFNLRSVTPEHNADPEATGGDPRVDIDGVDNRLDFHDRDGRDDGVMFYPLTYVPGATGRVEFTIGVFDQDSRRYAADAEHSLYVNLWIDWDTDGRWEESGGEHFINGLQINPRDTGAGRWQIVRQGAASNTTAQGESADRNRRTFRTTFTVPQIGCRLLWARMRLDYAEDVGRNDPRPQFRSLPSLRDRTLADGTPQAAGADLGFVNGAARYGEVEDYLIGSDFGDAPDAAGHYPTLKASAGARHLDVHQEWLGEDDNTRPNPTREIDANDLHLRCLIPFVDGGTDEDTISNVFPENTDKKCDGVFIPWFQPCDTIDLQVTVTSSISARGSTFTLRDVSVSPPEDDFDSLPRYDPTDQKRRLYLSGWADWNCDRQWATPGEKIIDDVIDPQFFGADGVYTLGEAFTDGNQNGVRDEGEAFIDDFGVDTATFTYTVTVPCNVCGELYFRFRLAYGENEATVDVGVKENDEDGRANNEDKGGALFGEVEDYPVYPSFPWWYPIYGFTDLDESASIDQGDMSMLLAHMHIPPSDPDFLVSADFNRDDEVNLWDLAYLSNIVRRADAMFPADDDRDGIVDLADFDVFVSCYTGPNGDAAFTCLGTFDLDGDEDVDLADFSAFQTLFDDSTP